MSTLYVFGDSFAENSASSWTRLLASKLGYDMKNYARGGSCIEFSFLKLTSNENFKAGDVVVFVMTSPSRIVTNNTIYKDPTTAHILTPGGEDQQYLDWNVKIVPEFVIETKPTLYASYILNLSLQHPNVKFIVLKSFDFNVDGVMQTGNFMVVDHINLFKLSNAECRIPYNGQFNEVVGCDCRVNHFTNPNLEIFASMMYNVILLWDLKEFDPKKFLKGVLNTRIKTVDDIYRLYVDTGLIEKEFVDAKVYAYKNGFAKLKKPIWRLW